MNGEFFFLFLSLLNPATSSTNQEMEKLQQALCPLPKVIRPHSHGSSAGALGEGDLLIVPAEVQVCAVISPSLASGTRSSLLRVASHLHKKLKSAFNLQPQLRASFGLPHLTHQVSTAPGIPHVGAIYIRLGADGEGALSETEDRAAWPGEADSEGYTLVVAALEEESTAGRVEVTGRSCRGAFYGVQTLLQLLRASNGAGAGDALLRLPLVEIVDQPDFPVRGVMLDVSRDKGTLFLAFFLWCRCRPRCQINGADDACASADHGNSQDAGG